MVDFSTHNFVLCLSDDQCDLQMKLLGFDSIVSCKFESVGDLLSVLLNRCYYPDLVSLQQLRAMGKKTNTPDKQPLYNFMNTWNHDMVYTIIREIYHSEDNAINALPPSQRFRIQLAFRADMFSCEYVEQPFSYPHPILVDTAGAVDEFMHLSTNIKREEKINQHQAMYKASCRIAQKRSLYLPKLEQYWFKTMQDMIMWLLRYVMEHDKYIMKCEHCDRYYIPKRNTKKYCSEKCANAQRNLDSFCGVEEIKQLYKRIVSNLRGKDQRMKKLNKPYHRRDKPDEPINPEVVLLKFYSDNGGYINKLREAYEKQENADIPTTDQKDAFEQAKTVYLEWLQKQHKYATSLKLDRDA